MKYLLILLLFSLNACGFIHFMATKPVGDRDKAVIQEYLHKNKFTAFDYNFQAIDTLIDSLDAAKHALDTWKTEHGTPQSKIQFRVYDSIGDLINGYTQCYGDFKKLNMVKTKEFSHFPWLPNNYNLRFEDDPELWDISNAQKQELLSSNHHKYTIVIYWNIWSNYYSRIMLKELNKHFERYKDKDLYRVILVNTDRDIKNKE